MLPSLVTQFIILVKDTSLASIIGYMDLTKAAQTVNQREIRPFELYLFIAVVYWVLCYGMSLGSRALERRLSCHPHAAGAPAPRARPRRRLWPSSWRGCAGGLREEVARQDAGLADLRTGRRAAPEGPPGPPRRGRGIACGARGRAPASAAAAREAEDAAGARGAGRPRGAPGDGGAPRRGTGRRGRRAGDRGRRAGRAVRPAGGGQRRGPDLPPGLPGPGRRGPPISAEELFDRGMESFRAGELGQAVLDFERVRREAPDPPARGERPLLDRRGLFPEPRLRACGRRVPAGDRPRPDRGADTRRAPPARARPSLAPAGGSGARGVGAARPGLPGERGGAPGPRRASPAGPRGPAGRASIAGDPPVNPASTRAIPASTAPEPRPSVFLTMLRRRCISWRLLCTCLVRLSRLWRRSRPER